MIVEYAGKKFTSYGKPAILEFQNGGLRLCEIVVLRNQLREIARNYAELCALYDEYAVAMHGVAARLFLCFRLEQVDWFAFDALQCDFFLAARQIEIEGCVGGLAHGVQYVGIGRIGDICGIFHDILAHEFRKIYACSFLYDVDGLAYWPAVAVNYTNKTQFIFKINKGIESVYDSHRINEYIEEEERPVPFRRMIYFGDGTTDIPCMRLVKQQGGHSIAVYNPSSERNRQTSERLLHDQRVNYVCPADYRVDRPIDRLVHAIIDRIASDENLRKFYMK